MFTKLTQLVIIFILLLTGAVMAQSKLTIPEDKFDFGYVPQNAKISHVYWLHSTGTDSLLITNVRPGCGCTKAPLEKTELGANDSTALEVIFSTRQYRGKQTKRPTITANTTPPEYRVEFSATVVDKPDETYPIMIEPYKFDISQFGDAERTKLKFKISNLSKEDLNIKIIDLNNNMFNLDMPSKVKAGKTVEGEIEIKPEYVDEQFEKSLTIELTDSLNSRFTIPIKRTIRDLASK